MRYDDLRTVALLILLTTAAGTGIVTANSSRHTRTSSLIGSGATPITTSIRTRPRGSISAPSHRFRTFIAITFGLTTGPRKIIHIRAHLARHFTLWFWLLYSQGNFAAYEFEQFIYDIALDG